MSDEHGADLHDADPHGHPAVDSAGRPWAGRTFQAHDTAYAGDDGSADPALLTALRAFSAGEVGEAAVVDALRGARLLIPLLAHAGDEGVNEHGVTVDKTQELAIVTVQGPDGRAVLPAFTSVDTLRAWDPQARPVPAESRRVAVAAAGEGTQLMVLDPASATEFGLRRPALWALAQDLPWVPAYADDEVGEAFLEGAGAEAAVASVTVAASSASARLDGPEVVVRLALRPGLDREALSALLGRVQANWAASDVIRDRVDSLAVKVVAAE
ncbi:SseB family protein [Frondihabitans australicus]|uniref:Type III secretion system (T3SS) SseB-like protein n=1 Tax=Frondihabitans australicus TaxID=386892 RepID=A0A495IER1_9MICO|nr:SseB family protein [Frondihabitans australicus]RKR74473.1 type III secretion system (T3SS) SseB-like protein [Frondihabitans australicus]